MAGHHTSMSRVKMSKKGGKKHRAKRMTIERADNGGYSTRTEFEQPPMDPNNPPYMGNPAVPDHTAVHANMADLQDHQNDMFGEEPDGDEGQGGEQES